MSKEVLTIYVDIDDTICKTNGMDYPNAAPMMDNIKRVNDLYDEGHTIVYWTARGQKSGIDWYEVTKNQLITWGAKHHDLKLTKPPYDVFIDDKVINSRDWEKGQWLQKWEDKVGHSSLKILERAKQVLELESQAVRGIPLDETIVNAVDLILTCKGKVVTSGMGKAGIIAHKISSTFSSTGTPSIFLHPGEAQHGDLGMLGREDVLLVFSNSGKTREIIELVDLSHKMLGERLPIIAVTSHPDSPLKEIVNVVLNLGRFEEACPLKMAPTTSTTTMLALGDVLCVLVMEEKGITKEDFAKRHHGGYLGERSKNHG